MGQELASEIADRIVRVDSGVQQLSEFLRVSGWTDGLPVVPPTVELVAEMVAAFGRPADEVIAKIPPSFSGATVELLAANAVLAGCRPSAARVLLAAVQAITDPGFNLLGVQATTHPCGVLVLVSGPAAATAEIHGGEGCFGPGFAGNLTIGRAIRLILMNIGGAHPGIADHSCQGTPAKISYCFTENTSASPWPPFHVEMGWKEQDSVVTVFAAEAPHNIQDHTSTTAEGILDTIAGAIRNVGCNNFDRSLREKRGTRVPAWRPQPAVVFGPEHARTVAEGGFDRTAIQRFLWERSAVPRSQIPIEWRFGIDGLDEIPMTSDPDDIVILVAGGVGKHSCWIPTIGGSSTSSAKIATR